MIRQGHIKTVMSALLTICTATGTALACAFHSYTPDETIVDKMLASEHIVLARADPANPFRYQAVHAIAGTTQNVDLPQLVDSATRLKLSQNAEDAVLFARSEAYGPWERLAYIDQDYRPVLAQITANLEAWQYGGDEERYQLFATLSAHENPDLQVLALKELDRAPYDLLTSLDFAPDPTSILSRMWEPDMVEFLPIHVLLLGLSGQDAASAPLRDGLDKALHLQVSPFIGAWATALIELEGPEAATRIADRMVNDASLTRDTRESLVEALAIHALADTDGMAGQIETLIAQALEQDVAFASMVARQWGRRALWGQTDSLKHLLHSGALTSAEAVISVTHYLSFAQQATDEPAVSSN